MKAILACHGKAWDPFCQSQESWEFIRVIDLKNKSGNSHQG